MVADSLTGERRWDRTPGRVGRNVGDAMDETALYIILNTTQH